MKPQLFSQIRAKIGRCHLHSKKQSSYSITLKMGSKAVTATEYKMSNNQQIDFNCQLSLQVDRHIIEGPGKLSIIVNMLSEQKQKKVVGSVFANLKQLGMQTYKVSQCSCKDKGFEVQIGFEVVNIQNLNNNHNNNKFHSPNQSEMKDLKQTLAVSREKQLVKNIKGKKSTAAKSPMQKTEAKVKTSRNQKQFQSEISMSQSHSELTKILPSKQYQENKQIISNLKQQIKKLQQKLKLQKGELLEKQKYENTLNKQMDYLQKTVQQLRNQNICLLQLLKNQEEKNSAAIEYIDFMSNFIKYAALDKIDENNYSKLVKNIKQNSKNTGFCQQQLQNSIRLSRQYSFGNKTIEEKDQYLQINGQLTQQLQLYKMDNLNLKKQIQALIINRQIRSTDIQDFKVKFNNAQSETKKVEDNLKHLTCQYEKMKKNYAQTLKDSQKLQSSLLELTNLKQQQQKKLHQIQKQLQDKQRQIQTKNKQFQQEKSKLKKIDSLNRQLKDQILQLKKKIQVKQTQIQKLTNSLEQNIKLSQFNKSKQIQKVSNQDKSQKQQIKQALRQIQILIPDTTNNQMAFSRRTAFQDGNEFQQNKSLLSELEQVSRINPQEQTNFNLQITKKNKVFKQRSTEAESQASQASAAMAQKYNYNYDVDSVNYFNNFNDNHVDIQDSLVQNGELEEVIENQPDDS